jgi:hypothetical protein
MGRLVYTLAWLVIQVGAQYFTPTARGVAVRRLLGAESTASMDLAHRWAVQRQQKTPAAALISSPSCISLTLHDLK